jgi:ferredoxin-NADP reductase
MADCQVKTIQQNAKGNTLILFFGWREHHRQHTMCGHRADGDQAQRSYSVASSPARRGEIELAVTYLEDGEVSSYMHNILVPGDSIEVRGPIGGYFVWNTGMGGPLLLVAGGSGIAPLMSMIRCRADAGSAIPARLLFSSAAWRM